MAIMKKQGVAWIITAVMIVAAIAIGLMKAEPRSGPSGIPPSGTPHDYVRDDAGVLSDRTLTLLTQRNQRLYERYDVVIGVVTCNYGRDDLDSYAIKRAEDMGLGGYDFIVVLDIRGDNYWLIQGADLVRYFTDDDCADYAWDYMEQNFARGDYDAAVLDLTEMLEAWYGTYFG